MAPQGMASAALTLEVPSFPTIQGGISPLQLQESSMCRAAHWVVGSTTWGRGGTWKDIRTPASVAATPVTVVTGFLHMFAGRQHHHPGFRASSLLPAFRMGRSRAGRGLARTWARDISVSERSTNKLNLRKLRQLNRL